MVPDEAPKRIDPLKPTEPRPQELVNRLDEVEQQDLNPPAGTPARPEPDWPSYGLGGEDEGTLGEGGQLRGPDAGGGGSS
jgi:hypothetical protein